MKMIINHLTYMDDIRQFAPPKKNLDSDTK